MNIDFYQCNICGKFIGLMSDTIVPTVCCGQTMNKVVPNTTDGAVEKHLPVYEIDGNKVYVRVGIMPHPMTEVHHISWIGLRTTHGFQFKELEPDTEPEVKFSLCKKERVEAVYAFCNLHGLWCAEEEAK